jgi:hypothetical protein
MDTTEAVALLGLPKREVTAVEDISDGTLVTTKDANTWHVATLDGEVVRYGDEDELRAGEPVVALFDGPATDPKLHPENLRTPLYSGTGRRGDLAKTPAAKPDTVPAKTGK